MPPSNRWLALWAAVFAGLAGAAPAPAQVAFTKVADTATAIPGGTGPFGSFQTSSVVVNGPTVAFIGANGLQAGVYVSAAGSLGVVANASTPVPGGTGSFGSFSNTAVSGTTVAFTGGLRNSPPLGVYTGTAGGPVTPVANGITAVPGGTGTFTAGVFNNVSLTGTTVAFRGGGSGGQQGVYARSAGALQVVADTTTGIPGGTGTFTAGFSPGTNSGAAVAFRGAGAGGQQGIYVGAAGSAPGMVADTTTPIPGGTGTFNGFLAPVVGGPAVTFVGSGTGQSGIYRGTVGGPLAVLADRNTATPGGTGNFTAFSPIAVSGATVAFLGFDAGSNQGIYYETGGEAVAKLVARGDTLDGKTVTVLGFSESGIDGSTVAFYAAFSDGTSGVYTAALTPVPEPGTLALGGVAAAGLAAWRRRRTATV